MDTYEKKYKGALARCKWLLSEGMISRIAATDMFRELMDNDSENIRKEIINIFHSLAEGKIPVDINYADIFTWLEKQGEQKPTIEMKSTEESLGIDSETYNKIVDECIYGDDKQKPAWSEEDEEHYKACLQYFDAVNPDMVYYKDYQWLKSLKQRIGG